MNPITRLATVAIVAAVAVGGALFVLRPASQVGPPTPTVSPSPSAVIANGIYFGPTLQVADLVAAMNADPTLTSADRTKIIDVYLEIKDQTTWRDSIELLDGQLTERQTLNGYFTVVGSFGRYAFPDDHTLVYTESIDGYDVTTVFDLSVAGDSFTLHRTTPAHDAADEFVTRVIFESGPFTLQR